MTDSGDQHAGAIAANADFAARFAAERARVLRRRVFWFLASFLGLMVLSAFGTLTEAGDIDGDPAKLRWTKLGLVYDGLLVLVCAAGIAYVWWRRPERASLVMGLTATFLAAMVIAMPFEIFQAQNDPVPPGTSETWWRSWRPGMYALGAFVLVFSLAAVLVPMRVRESVSISVPCWGAYIAALASVGQAPPTGTMFVLGALFPASAAIGVAWSAWRYSEFDARFRADELKGQYKEIAAELSYARRIHEALFPPAVERGPVRVAYRYEPMREIGGDFLFVHPLAHPPASHDGPVTGVVLDVTGHGVPAALAVNRLHGELQRLFASNPRIAPGEALAGLNAYAHASLTPSAVYASALVVRVDPGRNMVEWASAGHPPALVRRASGAIEELAPTAVMLGVLEPDFFEAGERSIPMQRGDIVLAYTDGATEAMGTGGAQLGARAVAEVVGAAAPARSAGRIAEAVMERVRQHRVGRVTDDTLIVEMGLAES